MSYHSIQRVLNAVMAVLLFFVLYLLSITATECDFIIPAIGWHLSIVACIRF